jgi:hypothetical protein|nr:MAG TPA: hypothetical protein [Herelleviridae sp.]
MLNNVSIDIKYYDAVTTEVLEAIMNDNAAPIQVKILITTIMLDFAQRMKDKLFEKMEDK